MTKGKMAPLVASDQTHINLSFVWQIRTLFAQVIGLLPNENIKSIISKADTDKHCKGYNTWCQLISMIFCQFSNCDSVRDISNGLKSATGNLNHLSIIRAPLKSTVAYQNAHRDSNVFRDIFYALFRHFGQQAAWQRKGFRFKMPIKLLDSTLISLTMSVYDWAHYTTKKGAIKMHTLLDYDCLLTDFVHITDVKSPTIRRLMKLMSGRIALWLPTVDIAAMDF